MLFNIMLGIAAAFSIYAFSCELFETVSMIVKKSELNVLALADMIYLVVAAIAILKCMMA